MNERTGCGFLRCNGERVTPRTSSSNVRVIGPRSRKRNMLADVMKLKHMCFTWAMGSPLRASRARAWLWLHGWTVSWSPYLDFTDKSFVVRKRPGFVFADLHINGTVSI